MKIFQQRKKNISFFLSLMVKWPALKVLQQEHLMVLMVALLQQMVLLEHLAVEMKSRI